MRRIKIADYLFIDLDSIALAKKYVLPVSSSDKSAGTRTTIEIVLNGDKQVYRYNGKPGEILWEALEISSIK